MLAVLRLDVRSARQYSTIVGYLPEEVMLQVHLGSVLRSHWSKIFQSTLIFADLPRDVRADFWCTCKFLPPS